MSDSKNCSRCGTHWADNAIETLGAALYGGGYRRVCNNCGYVWDDLNFSYGELADYKNRHRIMLQVDSKPYRVVNKIIDWSPAWLLKSMYYVIDKFKL